MHDFSNFKYFLHVAPLSFLSFVKIKFYFQSKCGVVKDYDIIPKDVQQKIHDFAKKEFLPALLDCIEKKIYRLMKFLSPISI